MSVHIDTQKHMYILTHSTRKTLTTLKGDRWKNKVNGLFEFMSIPSCGSISKIREAFIILKNHGGAMGSHLRTGVEGLTGVFQRLNLTLWRRDGGNQRSRLLWQTYHLIFFKYKPSEKVEKEEKHTAILEMCTVCVCNMARPIYVWWIWPNNPNLVLELLIVSHSRKCQTVPKLSLTAHSWPWKELFSLLSSFCKMKRYLFFSDTKKIKL